MSVERKRLFFALWPDVDAQRAITQCTAESVAGSGGNPVRLENLHMTVAFLHSVDVSLLPCISRAARQVARQPLNLTLSSVGHWQRSGILWLAPDLQGGASAGALAGELWNALSDCGFTPERRPFRPHVTLARKVSAPLVQTVIRPVMWDVGDLVLVESTNAGSHTRYEVLHRFGLGV